MNLRPGIISLVRFPQSDLEDGRYRPIVLLAPLPSPFGDWLTCAVTSQLRHKVDDWDEIIDANDPDFLAPGLNALLLYDLETCYTGVKGIEGSWRNISSTS